MVGGHKFGNDTTYGDERYVFVGVVWVKTMVATSLAILEFAAKDVLFERARM